MIKVSIVVPVYNVEKYLRECLESIIQQSLEEIEIICVNDGSTDNSAEILKEYAEKESRIIVINKQNTGYGHSVNIGIQHAQGEYLGIVESDDFIHNNMYETLYNKAKEFNVDIIKADYMQVYKDKEGKTHYFETNITLKESDYNRIIDIANEDVNTHIPFASWAGIYRTEFLKKNNIVHNETPGASYQDVGFCTLTTLMSKSIMYYPKAFYRYRIDNPDSSVKSKQKVYCGFEEYTFIKAYLKQQGEIYEKYKINLVHRCLVNYVYHMYRIDNSLLYELVIYIQEYIHKVVKEHEYNDKWFTQEQKQLFDLILYNPKRALENIIYMKEIEAKRTEKLIKIIEEYDSVILYGAGAVGKQLLNRLIALHRGHKICCYAVTEEGEEQFINNIQVKRINQIKHKDSLVIIAVSPTKSADMMNAMIERAKELEFKHIITYEELSVI